MTAEIALRAEPTEQGMRENAPAALVAWAEAASAAHRLAAPLVQTDFVPAHFRPKGSSDEALRTAQASATAAVLFGAEAGLTPMQALQGIYVISGRPAMYARTMLAVTLAQGHDVWTEDLTDTRAVVCGRRRGGSQVERVAWTMDRAKKAGYTKNAKYGTDPQSMLLARAQSDVCRRIAPDALLGMAYSVEELELEDDPEPTSVEAGKPRRTARRAPLTPVATEPSLDPDPSPADTAEATTDHNDAPDPGGITDAQLTKLNIQLQEGGYDDRDEKLRYLTLTLGRDIGSSKDLTRTEAHRLIEAFEQGVEIAEPPLDPA
jgi:hypothetical protein